MDRQPVPTFFHLLVHELRNVTEWDVLGILLGLEVSEIDDIKRDHRNNALQRIVMLAKWLDKDRNASWEKVIDGLESMSMSTLGKRLKDKYMYVSQSPVQPVPVHSHSKVVLAVHSSDSIHREIEDLMSKYLRLKVMAERAVAEINPDSISIKRFCEFYCLPTASSVEQLFDGLKSFHILEITMLKKIIDFFLKDSQDDLSEYTYSHVHLVFEHLRNYIDRLNSFNSSTTVQQFMENIAEEVQHSSADKSQSCNVCITLTGNWLTRTMAELEKIIQAFLEKRLSLMHFIKVKKVDSHVQVNFQIPSQSSLLDLTSMNDDKSFFDSQGIVSIGCLTSAQQDQEHREDLANKGYSVPNKNFQATSKSSDCSSTTTSSSFTADNTGNELNEVVLGLIFVILLMAYFAIIFIFVVSFPILLCIQSACSFFSVNTSSASAPVNCPASKRGNLPTGMHCIPEL